MTEFRSRDARLARATAAFEGEGPPPTRLRKQKEDISWRSPPMKQQQLIMVQTLR